MSLGPDQVQAIALRAFAAVLRHDPDFEYREVMRWYSREFSTPLAAVADLPQEEVWQHWYEDQYQRLRQPAAGVGDGRAEASFHQAGILLVRTDADVIAERRREAEGVASADDFAAEVAADERAAATRAAQDISRGLAELRDAVQTLRPLTFDIDPQDDPLAGNLPLTPR